MTVDRRIINDLDFQGAQKVKNAVDGSAPQDYATMAQLAAAASPVSSVFGRAGAVIAVTGDYYGAVAAALTGATQASRYVGATASGAPVSGTFVKGDWVVGQDGHIFVCTSGGTPGTWVDVGGGGGAPSGPAGGSLSGTYPNPGIAAGAIGAPELASTAVTPSTYGDSSHVGQFTVDADGRITGASSVSIPGVGAGGTVKLYDFTVTGSAQAAIDTNVDGTTVADFSGHDVLEFWIITRTDDVAAVSEVDVIVNNDGSSIYDRQVLQGNGGTAGAGGGHAQSRWILDSHGAGGSANYAAVHRFTIPGYSVTTFNKTGEFTGELVDATAGNNWAQTGIVGWRSNAAITRLKVFATGSQKLVVGSRLIVYGR